MQQDSTVTDGGDWQTERQHRVKAGPRHRTRLVPPDEIGKPPVRVMAGKESLLKQEIASLVIDRKLSKEFKTRNITGVFHTSLQAKINPTKNGYF